MKTYLNLFLVNQYKPEGRLVFQSSNPEEVRQSIDSNHEAPKYPSLSELKSAIKNYVEETKQKLDNLNLSETIKQTINYKTLQKLLEDMQHLTDDSDFKRFQDLVKRRLERINKGIKDTSDTALPNVSKASPKTTKAIPADLDKINRIFTKGDEEMKKQLSSLSPTQISGPYKNGTIPDVTKIFQNQSGGSSDSRKVARSAATGGEGDKLETKAKGTQATS